MISKQFLTSISENHKWQPLQLSKIFNACLGMFFLYNKQSFDIFLIDLMFLDKKVKWILKHFYLQNAWIL